MAIRSKPYQISWELKAKDLDDINRRLALQLSRVDEMLDILFKAINNLTARIEALE